jgi:superoxide dismutase, Cu-Zn family
MKPQSGRMAVAVGLLGLAWACSQEAPAPQAAAQNTVQPPSVERAIAVLHPTEGNQAAGTVEFTRQGDGVHVVVRLEGLTPGEHGFHVHELGDCSAPNGSSAGGHFNPFGSPHGARDAAERHVGDLGNVTADDSGKVAADFVDARIALPGAAPENSASILGRGVIVHGGRDDLTSQPSGDAGARVACGVIGIASPKPPE